MKKSVLFLLLLLSVQGLHAQNAHPTFTWNETTKELIIDGNGGDLSPFVFNNKKFSESIYKDAVKITIKNVGTIEAQTFGDKNTEATLELYIYTSVNHINARAFDHLRVQDVFVVRDESNEKNNGLIPCELNAFDFNTSVNQTGTDFVHMAKLHIPDGDSFYEYYVGSWKSDIGLLSQESLNVCKDGGSVIIRYWENGQERTVTINGIEVANGFQQFASTDNENQIILSGSFIRTYSSDTPKKVPYYTTDQGEIDMFQAYRIKDYSYNATNGGTIVLESVIQNHIIPANTGVILKSNFEIKKDLIVYLGNVSSSEVGNLTPYPYQNDLSDAKANLLVPSTNESTNGVSVGPVDRNNQGEVTHRNFGLYYNSTDKYYYFSRYKPGNVPANKAYLKLTAEQFPNNNEDEKGIGTNLARRMVRQASQSTSTDQISIDLPESKYFDLEVIFVDNNLGVTTNIDKIDNITNNDKYYNLQGMEVKNPAKGVYIKNGKKIIVK